MKPEEARKWATLYSAIADGKKWQIQSSAGEWNDATNGVHDPRGWSIERLRIKPEPQHVYVATWFDAGGILQAAVMTSLVFPDGEERLKAAYLGRPGFRIDTFTRELP